MEPRRRTLFLLGFLVVVALPPLVAYAVAQAVFADWLAERGQGTVLAVAAGATVVWAAIVALVASRTMLDEARSLVTLARHGALEISDEDLTPAMRLLASSLEERNRQIASLARQVREAPITTDGPAVARSIVKAARSMTGDPTWEMAVVRADEELAAFPVGVYGLDTVTPAQLEQVHLWASTLEDAAQRGAHLATGPWGAFAVVDLAVGEELRAILIAPWEGRPDPSPAELDLLALLGQHAATTMEHALIYGRLRTQADELNRMAAAQSDFLRGVTHDLQTPLTSIGALAHELSAGNGVDEAGRADLAMIAHQADRLRRMVSQLLTVSRLEVGALTPRQEVFRVQPIIRRTWDALRADRPFQLSDDGPPLLLVADPDRVEQVLWAVMDNAVKYSPDGSAIQVSLTADEGDGCSCRIAISDEGAGMDEEALQRAFEQFYRSDVARRLSPDGSGLGLHAARGLVRAMGGEIAAESRLGAGTTVTITLPAERAEDPAVGG